MVRVQAETDEEGRVSLAVIEAVAEVDGTAPEDLPPLYGVVDLDALDRLFTATAGNPVDGRVTFIYSGYEVSVHRESDRTISVRADEPRDG